MVLPDKTVDLGVAILFAIPNKNKNKKPIKTNLKLDASLDITVMDTPQTAEFEQITKALNSLYPFPLSSGLDSAPANVADSVCTTCDVIKTEPLDCGCTNPSIITINDQKDNVSRHIFINNDLENKNVDVHKALIDNTEHIELVQREKKRKSSSKLKKEKLSSSIYGWISLGNLNYSFQQSLFWVSPYWNHTQSARDKVYVPMYREMRMQNNFLIPLKLESLCVFNCDNKVNMLEGPTKYFNFGQIDFEIVEFYKNKIILDGHNETICKLKFYPKSNATFYETQLILNTNITSFQIPMSVYSGRLNVISANMTNDIGTVEIAHSVDDSKHWFDPQFIERAITDSEAYVTDNKSFYFYNDEELNSTLITNSLYDEYYEYIDDDDDNTSYDEPNDDDDDDDGGQKSTPRT